MKIDDAMREAFARQAAGGELRAPRSDEVERALAEGERALAEVGAERDRMAQAGARAEGGRPRRGSAALGLRWALALGLCCAGIGAAMAAGAPRPLAELLASRIGADAEREFIEFMSKVCASSATK